MIEVSFLASTGDYDDDFLVSIILGDVTGHGASAVALFDGVINKIIYKDLGAYTEVSGQSNIMMAAMVIAKQS